MDQLQRETERLSDLHQRNLVPTEELERITSRRDSAAEALAQAEAGLNEAREQLAEASLRAPYSGIVSELHVEPGQFVAAGQPVLSLTGNNGLEVALHVSAGRASQLAIDTPVIVTHRDQALSTTGQIREIGPAMPGQPSVVIVELPPEASHWGAGQSVTVDLQGNGDESLSVPLAAVINPGAGRAHLFSGSRAGRVFSVDVTTGAIRHGRIIVSGALAEGDIVAIAGHSQLLDDEPGTGAAMNLIESALGRRPLILTTVVLMSLIGLAAWQGMDRQEDPFFPYRYGHVMVSWPGADPERVERLVINIPRRRAGQGR